MGIRDPHRSNENVLKLICSDVALLAKVTQISGTPETGYFLSFFILAKYVHHKLHHFKHF